MRRSLSILAAAVIAITGVASNAPAQAAMRAAPAVLDQAGQNADIVQVHRRRYRGARYYRYDDYRPRRYVRRHRHYEPYAYYPRYYGRPGVNFSFSFGGGNRYHGW